MIRRRNKKMAYLAASGVLLGWMLGGSASVRADEIPEKYRENVKKGLEYLVRMQKKDPANPKDNGYWGAGANDTYPVSMTGLAGIALLLEGSTIREGKYSEQIRKATNWLMEKSQRQAPRDGLIFFPNATETVRYMYGHGFATLFLACVYGDVDDEIKRRELKDILTRAVEYIGNAQSSKGGFYYTSRLEGGDLDEGSVTITQLQALRACRNAGIPVPKDLINKSAKYLEDSTATDGGVVYSLARGGARPVGGGKPALTAAAIACMYSTGNYQNKYIQDWFKFCKRFNMDSGVPAGGNVRLGHDEYTHYYFAQALYNLGDDGWDKMFPNSQAGERMMWSKYRESMFDYLLRIQQADGSFPSSNSGFSPGPVYATSVYCTIMQLDRGVVPFYQRVIGKSN